MSLFQRLPRLLTGMDESVRQVLYVHGINCASHPLLVRFCVAVPLVVVIGARSL